MSKWLVVEEELPEPDVKVLCLDFITDRHFDAAHSPKSGWYLNGRSMYVTHWQPLPEPPK